MIIYHQILMGASKATTCLMAHLNKVYIFIIHFILHGTNSTMCWKYYCNITVILSILT